MRVANRKFHREYEELEKYEAGIVLNGAEAKSIRAGTIRLDDAFVKIIGGEAYLINAEIPIYKFARPHGYDSRRTRKLLLHKKELLKMQVKIAGGNALTVAPVALYTKGRIFKLEIALAKGRKDVEKRKYDKSKDVKREQQRHAKEFMKD